MEKESECVFVSRLIILLSGTLDKGVHIMCEVGAILLICSV